MTANGNAVVRGLFLDFEGVRTCAGRLKILGVRPADLSVLLPDGSVVAATAIEFLKDRNARAQGLSSDARRPQTSASTLTRALLSMGIPVYISERLECRMRNGGVLLSLRCHSSIMEAAEAILSESGAEDVSSAPKKRIEILARGDSRKPYVPEALQVWPERAASA